MQNFGVLFILTLMSNIYASGQSLNDVLITEIMADPSPSVGLPEVEYLEFYNRTGKPVFVKGWRLVMGSRSAFLPDSVLFPTSYVLLCHTNSTTFLQKYGRVIGLATFSIPNEGGTLALYNQKNQLVYTVTYSDTWWAADKRSGGYGLEMLDMDNPCLEKGNWATSTDENGGTPNRQNSVKKTITDITPPAVERVDVTSENQLTIFFNERLDSISAMRTANFELSGNRTVKRKLETPNFKNLVLTFDSPLQKDRLYELFIHNLADCAGNVLREAKVTVGLPAEADSGDVVINEVLFNPRENGVDFVEIYNRSSRYVTLQNWSLGNLRNGRPDIVKPITMEKLALPPNQFLALSLDGDVLKEQYPTNKPRNFLNLIAMPSFPNEEGGVILMNEKGRIQDQFHYTSNMHHALVQDAEGVSLERINSNRASWANDNWHSAAGTVGYATPGYANSQVAGSGLKEVFSVEPEAFTPDLDGVDDVAEIKYEQFLSGRIATISVFDINGRLVKTLVSNQLIGVAGSITWNGTDNSNAVVKTGYYLILIDTFDISGNKAQFKKRVVVASK